MTSAFSGFRLLPALAFLLAAAGSAFMVELAERQTLAQRRAEVSLLAATHADAIQRNIERALSATYSLGALVRLGGGEIPGFPALAEQMLPFYQGASALALAPDGVVRQIVPLAGNEKAIGHDLLKDPQRDKEAILARESGQLILAGPFPLVQGGVAAAGRLPVYLDTAGGGRRFWGFVSVLVRFPETLAPAGLPRLVEEGYDYELSRIHPDTGKKQVIAASTAGALAEPVDHLIRMPNGGWTFAVAPRGGWRDGWILAERAALGLLFSLLVAVLAYAVERLRRQRLELEVEVRARTRDLAASELRYRTYVERAPLGIFVADASGRYQDVNPVGYEMVGYSREEIMAMSVADLAPAGDWPRQQALFGEILAGGGNDVELPLRRKDGSIIFVGLRAVLLPDGRVMGFASDITARREAEARMREALVVFNVSSQGIMTTDASGRITAANQALCKITGYAREEVIGQRSSMFKSGRHDADFYRAMWASIGETGQWEGEIWNQRKNGEIYPQWMSINAVRDPAGTVVEYVAMFNDISERKLAEEAIWRQANFDALTGLANRSLLADRLERALAQTRRSGKKVGLVFLDLDGFKWINDSLGHDVGDELLIEVARRLRGCIRDEDTAARLGGDEFTLIVNDLSNADDMLAIGEKVVAVLREPFALAGRQQLLSGSVGITVFPDDGEDVQTLLKNADIAMYKAKQGGKNRFQFYARHMQVDAQARMALEADLRQALTNGEFTLHYQPIVDADSGELVGAEALIRWLHPLRGMVSPLEFVPVAEDCGLILQIGEWVLREAARQWQAWSSRGLAELRLSVNVSGVQFREERFPLLVAEVIGEYGLSPGCLMLEITESVLLDDSPSNERRMQDIRALGVGFSLDDFGTGYSSLSYLKRFPVDQVKIDRSFVHDCPEDRHDVHLVEAIIGMAQGLNLRVTAEGVETEAQMEFLRDLGCDYLQGYLVGRPLPPDSFEVLIDRRQLLLPTDGGSLEGTRLLAALRDDSLDVDAWLRRLLGEHSPEVATYLAGQGWTSDGLDLRHAVLSHLEWRRRLDDFVGAGSQAEAVSVEAAAAGDRCILGHWLAGHPRSDSGVFRRLDRVHREFHRLAGQIVVDFGNGHRNNARRMLSGLQFRKASRDVVVALIDCFQDRGAAGGQGQNAEDASPRASDGG